MGIFTILITIILLAVGFTYQSIWDTKNKKQTIEERKNSSKEIENFFSNLKNVYNQYYPTIHMSNYFHYNCNKNNTQNPVTGNVSNYQSYFLGRFDCSDVASDASKQFRYSNILLLSNGRMCKVSINNGNNTISIQYNTCKKLKDWYTGGIISNIDYGILQKFIPPETGYASKLTGLLFKGVSGYKANEFTTIPFLKMEGILFKKITRTDYRVIKYYPVDTFSVIRNKVKAADTIIDNYSYYIRGYAKKIYSDTNYNPYVFRYSLASLFFSTSQNPDDKKAVYLPGITYYNLDTSLLVSLPNTYVYKEINGHQINDVDGNPLAGGTPSNYYEGLYKSSVNSPYKDDNIVNIDSVDKIYAMDNQAPNQLKSYDVSEWSANNTDVLFALLRLGKNCKAENYDTGTCKNFIWFNTEEKNSPMGLTPSIFNKLYYNVYKNIYNNTTFRGVNQYGAVNMTIKVNENTGEKEASVKMKKISDFYRDMFHIDIKKEMAQKDNPFFGKYVLYPGANIKADRINLAFLTDNTSNVNYGVPMIDDNTIAIYNGYSISFAIPYIVDHYDDGSNPSAIPGLYIKVYSITTIE